MFFTKSKKQWTDYTGRISETDLSTSGLSTEQLAFLNMNAATLKQVKEAATYILPHIDELVDNFYDNLTASDHLYHIITTYSSVEKLKGTQRIYLEQFLEAELDDTYIESRIKVGQIHSKINLTADHFIMAHNMLMQYMTTILMEKLHHKPDKMMKLVTAVQKLATFDQQLIVNVYMESTMRRYLFSISDLLNNMTEISTTKELLAGMDQQKGETLSVTTATEEMNASIQDVAVHATKVAENTEQAVTSVQKSQQVIDHALQEIEQVGSVYDVVIQDVNHLDKEIQNTQEVINVIREIAEQTNLLALNASIEAARAGDSGKGFAVVATEVRKLSEHTQEQIERITTNMGTLQNVSKQVTDRIEQTGDNVDKSVTGSRKADEELERIVETMQEINGATSQIAAMSEEQSATVNDISDRNTTMHEVSEKVHQTAQETAASIYTLSEKMNEYRLSFLDTKIIYRQQDILRLAKTDHLLWKWDIYNLLLNVGSIDQESLTSHHECRLGKWYYSEQSNGVQHLKAFKQLEAPHKAVHDNAKLAVESHERGDTDRAQDALTQLENASNQVIRYLEELEEAL